MNLDAITGTYHESGVWKDSTGNVGVLAGAVSIRHLEGRLEFAYEDGSRQVSGLIDTHDQPVELNGTLGNGNLFLGDASLILEYEAEIEGRKEFNTDVWMQSEGSFRRAGVIRQSHRSIWFEAEMLKQPIG